MTATRWNRAVAGSGLVRLLGGGLRDAECRLARLTAPSARDESRVVEIVGDSAVVRGAQRVAHSVTAAGGGSAIAGAVAAYVAPWAAAWRARETGLVLTVAALTYIGLSRLGDVPPGWLWLILPLLAATAGVMLVLGSWPARADRP